MRVRLAINDLFFVLDEKMCEKTLEANLAEVGPLSRQDAGDYMMNTLRARLSTGHDAWIIGHRALPDPSRHTLDPYGSPGRHWIRAAAVYYLANVPG
ncbi:hypothetical protein [Cryptosporangium aurantiacum]|nr:hypothetical protein [Cryptosporangium aurantiacum]